MGVSPYQHLFSPLPPLKPKLPEGFTNYFCFPRLSQPLRPIFPVFPVSLMVITISPTAMPRLLRAGPPACLPLDGPLLPRHPPPSGPWGLRIYTPVLLFPSLERSRCLPNLTTLYISGDTELKTIFPARFSNGVWGTLRIRT
jgi:hypothetical protein